MATTGPKALALDGANAALKRRSSTVALTSVGGARVGLGVQWLVFDASIGGSVGQAIRLSSDKQGGQECPPHTGSYFLVEAW